MSRRCRCPVSAEPARVTADRRCCAPVHGRVATCHPTALLGLCRPAAWQMSWVPCVWHDICGMMSREDWWICGTLAWRPTPLHAPEIIPRTMESGELRGFRLGSTVISLLCVRALNSHHGDQLWLFTSRGIMSAALQAAAGSSQSWHWPLAMVYIHRRVECSGSQ